MMGIPIQIVVNVHNMRICELTGANTVMGFPNRLPAARRLGRVQQKVRRLARMRQVDVGMESYGVQRRGWCVAAMPA